MLRDGDYAERVVASDDRVTELHEPHPVRCSVDYLVADYPDPFSAL